MAAADLAPGGGDVDALRRAAEAARAAGRGDDVARYCAALLALRPDDVPALQLAAAAALGRGDVGGALAHLTRAASVARDDEGVQADRAGALFHAGRYAEAVDACATALAVTPGSVRLWFALGAARVAAGDAEGGEEAYRRVLAIDPAHVDTLVNLAVLLQRRGRLDDALASYRQVLAIEPAHPVALGNAAGALLAARRPDEAAPLLRKVLVARPGDVAAAANLGLALTELPQFAEGVQMLRELARRTGNPAYALKADLAIPPLLPSNESIVEFRAAFEAALDRWCEGAPKLGDPLAIAARTSFYLAYQGHDDRRLQQKVARLYMAACPALDWVSPSLPAPAATGGRRIRIGFVSMFLRNHTIGKLFRGLIGGLDGDEFERFVFAPVVDGDPVQSELAAAGVAVVGLPGALDAARRLIAGHGLDILFYPDIGMHPFTYLLAFSRLAPVQMASWGHPVTTGIPAIDCFVSHALCEDGDTTAQYSERLLQMPAAVPYTRYRRPSYAGRRRERSDFGLPAGRTLYLVPHALFKLTPDFVAALRALLAADPAGVLVFAGPAPRAWCDVVRGRLAPMGTAANLYFLGALSPGDFLELLRLGDVLLDSFDFGGGNTTAEALFAGVPIVTLPGRLMRGRFTYAWLRHAGLEEGIARSADDYVARALRFGGDAELRLLLRRRTLAAAAAIDADARPVAAFATALREGLVGGPGRS